MSNEDGRTGRYRKRLRAEQERRTRERITEAAVKLHGTVGPARTTVSGVAEEAGVQRGTVYRHFPDEASLFDACSAHFMAANPPPDPQEWSSISEPRERLKRALRETYAYYRRTEAMLEKVTRDAPVVESMARSMEALRAWMEAAASALSAGRPERGESRRRMRAALGHALSFPTWQSLVREQGLDDREAVALMAAAVDAAGRARPAKA